MLIIAMFQKNRDISRCIAMFKHRFQTLVPHPHNAQHLGESLFEGVHRLSPGLVSKVWAVTADNVKVNEGMITHFKKLKAEFAGESADDCTTASDGAVSDGSDAESEVETLWEPPPDPVFAEEGSSSTPRDAPFNRCVCV
eukprot:GHVU01109009.1.p1 GENE.GHVU01109009.1~~GHVU01109009.1.p1  ORF type:complete len:140 (+),score=15.69 GHVU01109009.1:150-569(+)